MKNRLCPDPACFAFVKYCVYIWILTELLSQTSLLLSETWLHKSEASSFIEVDFPFHSCTTSSLLKMFQCTLGFLPPRLSPHRRCLGEPSVSNSGAKLQPIFELTKFFSKNFCFYFFERQLKIATTKLVGHFFNFLEPHGSAMNRCSSALLPCRKRVQNYNTFPYPPNFSATFFNGFLAEQGLRP